MSGLASQYSELVKGAVERAFHRDLSMGEFADGVPLLAIADVGVGDGVVEIPARDDLAKEPEDFLGAKRVAFADFAVDLQDARFKSGEPHETPGGENHAVDEKVFGLVRRSVAVSYTHLTLPTIYSV